MQSTIQAKLEDLWTSDEYDYFPETLFISLDFRRVVDALAVLKTHSWLDKVTFSSGVDGVVNDSYSGKFRGGHIIVDGYGTVIFKGYNDWAETVYTYDLSDDFLLWKKHNQLKEDI